MKPCPIGRLPIYRYFSKTMNNFNRNDLILIFLLLLLAVLAFGIWYAAADTGDWVEITVDGEVVREVPLSSQETIEIGGKNRIVIENGTVCVSQADCPDQLCVRQGTINRAGQSIICLPNRVSVTIKAKQDSLDGIVR